MVEETQPFELSYFTHSRCHQFANVFTLCHGGILAAVLTCGTSLPSSGRDVSSVGQPNEGNGHYQNTGLMVSRQGFGPEGGEYSPVLS